MLTAYRRHGESCPHKGEGKNKGRDWTRCKCMIWADGTLGQQRDLRLSLDTRVWHQAMEKINKWNEAGTMTAEVIKGITFADARVHFEAEQGGLKLQRSTQKKYRVLLDQLDKFSNEKGLVFLSQLDLLMAGQFRQSWKDGAISANKKLERFKAYCRFLIAHGFMTQDWVKDWCAERGQSRMLKRAKETQPPTMPYLPQEMTAMIAATDRFAGMRSVHKDTARQIRCLVLVMRYSGLRIGDAASLACERLTKNKLFLYTQKTGVPVFTILPDFLVAELDQCPRTSPAYWFWSGQGSRETLSGNWRRAFRKMCKYASPRITGAHPHRFRDTFAVELLQAGVPMERVSILLGHKSVKITEKHYAPWVQARQDQLEADLSRALATDSLARSLAQPAKKLMRVK